MKTSRRGFFATLAAVPAIAKWFPKLPRPQFLGSFYRRKFTPEAIARASLEILRDELTVCHRMTVLTGFQSEFDDMYSVKVGDTITIRKPDRFIGNS